MEIVGIGTNIVECTRISRMIDRHAEHFLKRVFTAREIRYCQQRKRYIEHFAAHWAGKEAIFMALGLGGRRGLEWTEIEIRADDVGKQEVLLCGAAKEVAQKLVISNILLSSAHCRGYATANAIAVR